MNKKPPELPNIEDATLRACLAPLMEAMNPGPDPTLYPPSPILSARPPRPAPASGSNDNPLPLPDETPPLEQSYSGTPRTLAEWRTLADDDFAAFRMIELFVGMTDADLLTAAEDFPRQIGGTVARIARLKRRLALQYDTVTTAVALLERALGRAAGGRGED